MNGKKVQRIKVLSNYFHIPTEEKGGEKNVGQMEGTDNPT